ncbi:MAG: zinc-binding dehydrogenase [Rhizobiaceae bacterium]|nr:zinc-binding dehydrogenase [Rhizobiaceae bacterium]
MRAVVLNPPEQGTENMVVRDVDDPVPADCEVLVRVAYVGLNYADIMMRRGIYPHPKGYPLTAGIEMAGTIVAIAPGVEGVSVGDRVSAFCEDAGAFAELCAVPAARVLKLPRSLGLDLAAACTVQALTAWHLLHTVSTTRNGDVLLVHAIGGGVGLYLTQLAKHAGAIVIGTVGTPGKEVRALEYGADRVIVRTQDDFMEVVVELTDGRGVDKVIDSTGASILDRSFDAIRNLGHVVSYGEAEGKPYQNLWERLVRRSLTFTRLHIGHIDPLSEAWTRGAEAVMSMVEEGSLKVPVERIFDLSDVHTMYAALETRRISGKLLLKMSEVD